MQGVCGVGRYFVLNSNVRPQLLPVLRCKPGLPLLLHLLVHLLQYKAFYFIRHAPANRCNAGHIQIKNGLLCAHAFQCLCDLLFLGRQVVKQGKVCR